MSTLLVTIAVVHSISVLLLIKAVVQSDEAFETPCLAQGSAPACLERSIARQSGEALPWYRQITECTDHHQDCAKWANNNECATMPERLLGLCPASCKVCDNSQQDMISSCFGQDQLLLTGPITSEKMERFKATEDYMFQHVYVEEKYRKVRAECKNRHAECTTWAFEGHCETKAENMTLQCAPACFSCAQLDYDVRCPFDPNEPGVWAPGDLNKMFERVISEPAYHQYNVTIHSSPARYTRSPGPGPWVITLDDFLSPAECDRLIELGHEIGYERSQGQGKKLFDGSYESFENPTRTSTTAWCTDDCHEDLVPVAIQQRIANLTRIPDDNSEYMQLLRYQETQFYKLHHDFIPAQLEKPQGARILTVFLYLGDVDAGGGTNFPLLYGNLTVEPKRGRAVIWPSVLNSSPSQVDPRTIHQALAVEAGVKYSVNSWLHQKNFKIPMQTGCQ